MNQSQYLTLCATNQPVLARGDVSVVGLNNIHKKMDTLLGEEGAYLDDLLYCPHHPDKGFPGEITELKMHCQCRKPNSGLLIEFANKYNLENSSCVMVGDRFSDILAAQGARVNSILLLSGDPDKGSGSVTRPTYISSNLESSVDWILKDFERIKEIVSKKMQFIIPNCSIVLLTNETIDNCRAASQIIQQFILPDAIIFDVDAERILLNEKKEPWAAEAKLSLLLGQAKEEGSAHYNELVMSSLIEKPWTTNTKKFSSETKAIVPIGDAKLNFEILERFGVFRVALSR